MLMRATHLLEAAASLPLRQCAIFLCNFKLICPVQSRLQKYSASRLTQITPTTPAIPSRKRGVGHRHERWDGLRWTRQRQARRMFAGRSSVSEHQPRRRTALKRFRQKFGRRHWLAEWFGGGSCVRQNRVVLAPVAGVKSAEVCEARPGDASRQFAGDGGKTNSSPGRARHKP